MGRAKRLEDHSRPAFQGQGWRRYEALGLSKSAVREPIIRARPETGPACAIGSNAPPPFSTDKRFPPASISSDRAELDQVHRSTEKDNAAGKTAAPQSGVPGATSTMPPVSSAPGGPDSKLSGPPGEI